MKPELARWLRCPVTGQPLELTVEAATDSEVEAGTLSTRDGTHRYPVAGGIPRFVPAANYAANFGFQWAQFRQTQLDSHSGVPISRNRFYSFSGWQPSELLGKRVLDVGCGAGRFTEIALDAGAEVVALDYSAAVDACRANHRDRPNLNVVQGDIYSLPFAPQAFDYVYCFGVLQHTPDVRRAFDSLPAQLRRGGKLAVDVYPRMWQNLFWSKYWVRPLTRRMDGQKLFQLVQRFTPPMLRLSKAIARIPVIGPKARYLIPVVNYAGVYPFSDAQILEWGVLDTYDMLSPAFDQPQTEATLRRWLQESGLSEVSVERLGFIVGRGTKA